MSASLVLLLIYVITLVAIWAVLFVPEWWHDRHCIGEYEAQDFARWVCSHCGRERF